MRICLGMCWFAGMLATMMASQSFALVAGKSGRGDLVVASGGKTDAIIVVSPEAKRAEGPLSRGDKSSTKYERFAADELARCIELMCGARPAIADTPEAIAAALKERDKPVLFVGSEALKANQRLRGAIQKIAKPKPWLRSDAIAVQRDGNRVYMAGLTDDGHAHAVTELLALWGCRWYLPTEFGECIPPQDVLAVGKLDYAYASPFEVRSYWISWNGSYEGYIEFQLHNRMTVGLPAVSTGHALGGLTQELVPEGKTVFNVPIADERTAQHIATKLIPRLTEKGEETASLSVADGIYRSDSELDEELQAGLFDKYFLVPSMSDVFMTLYNRTCEIIRSQFPNLAPRIGFLAYSNMTLPPQKVLSADKWLYCDLAPIDIDPNHSMDDPWSPPRQEYRETMYRWAQVMDGRVKIYDYDQGMLVWRDIPNPSHQAFRHDVKHYAKAGILGVSTESRNAIASTFLNLHLRGQLMWNPECDVDKMLADFYPAFYGPAAEPMQRYWDAIFEAWEDTIVTEHEFFAAPAIYTPELIGALRKHLEAGEKAVAPLRGVPAPSRVEAQVLDRMKFTRLSFEVLANYMEMVFRGATDCDYKTAHEAGKRALNFRLQLGGMNPTFTTRVVGPAKEPEYGGSPAWFPGEVKLYGDLEKLINGTEGELLEVLPLEWAFRRDPNDTGLAAGWGYAPGVDLSTWNAHRDEITPRTRKDYPVDTWEMLRTDQYMQAQGILHPDRQAFTGYAWYQTTVKLEKRDADRNIHIRFPGLFAEAWLYVNGTLVGYRSQKSMWWYNDYGFEWDVNVSDALKPGENLIVVRNSIEHHVGGMFRRPFLYVPAVAKSEG